MAINSNGRNTVNGLTSEERLEPASAQARNDSIARPLLTTLMSAERARYLAPAAQWELKPDAPEQLRQAARRVDDLRFAAARKGTGGHL